MGKWPSLDKIEMDRRSDRQGRLRRQARRSCSTGCSTCRSTTCAPAAGSLIGLDGWDAAGKGGLIERIVDAPRAELGPCLAHRRADARGAGPALSLALLEPPAGARQLGDLRPHLVRPRAGRAHRGFLQQGRLEARLSRDQRVRAPARRRRRAHRQAPGPCQRGGAEAAHDRAAGRPAQALQDRAGGLPQHRQAQAVPRGVRRHAGEAPTPTMRPGTSSRPTTRCTPG